MISVILASRFFVMREGMREILLVHHDIQVIGDIEDVQEIRGNAALFKAQVIIVAAFLPNESLDYLLYLSLHYPFLRVVIIARSPTPQYVMRALQAGVFGMINAACAKGNLSAAIRSVVAGKAYLPDDVSRMLESEQSKLDMNFSHSALTSREKQIFIGLALGRKSYLMAIDLGISSKTVSTHKIRIMKKLGLKNLAEFTQYAITHGLLIR